MIRLVRGTGESTTTHMLSSLPGQTLDNVSEIRPIGMRTFRQSCTSIRLELLKADRMAQESGDTLFVVGYSLGAAGAVLAAPDLEALGGMILLGNPFAWGTPQRYGCAGRIGLGNLGIPVVDLTVPGDPIADMHAADLARKLIPAVTQRPQPTPIVPDIGAMRASVSAYLDRNGPHTAYERLGYVDRARRQLASWGAKP